MAISRGGSKRLKAVIDLEACVIHPVLDERLPHALSGCRQHRGMAASRAVPAVAGQGVPAAGTRPGRSVQWSPLYRYGRRAVTVNAERATALGRRYINRRGTRWWRDTWFRWSSDVREVFRLRFPEHARGGSRSMFCA